MQMPQLKTCIHRVLDYNLNYNICSEKLGKEADLEDERNGPVIKGD